MQVTTTARHTRLHSSKISPYAHSSRAVFRLKATMAPAAADTVLDQASGEAALLLPAAGAAGRA
jgi:hypothetical protein